MSAPSGTTYPRVVELLKAVVAEKGQRAVSRESGVTQPSIQQYLKGIGVPNAKTLQKLADYFGVSVAELRGEDGVGVEFTEDEIARIDRIMLERGYTEITAKTRADFVAKLADEQMNYREYVVQRRGKLSGFENLQHTDFKSILKRDIILSDDREILQVEARTAEWVLYAPPLMLDFFQESLGESFVVLQGLAKQVIEKYEDMLAGCAPKERKRLLSLRKEFEQQRRDTAPGFIYPDAIDSNND